jgi:hypothetical protein
MPSTNKGIRASSTKRHINSYDVTFQLLKFKNHMEYRPNGQSPSITCPHAHSLDKSDTNKRNSLIRGIARAEIAKGYPLAAMIRALNGNGHADTHERLTAAKGAFLDYQDIINAGLT